ncbi:hypothetical protein [Alkalicoccobacillus murimartini]|uniref:Uncharacterized protein n=1 Tax=Alkalicoccobacillus murimartini TaxID=171685 RepID=A0ABT9YMA0_9BACI|nr:hypothetical protein [Alkalicoccobacillus murimartini]MDQ0208871.1 hypothetical protein [Alkalicoccobacillus murimartini]
METFKLVFLIVIVLIILVVATVMKVLGTLNKFIKGFLGILIGLLLAFQLTGAEEIVNFLTSIWLISSTAEYNYNIGDIYISKKVIIVTMIIAFYEGIISLLSIGIKQLND